MSTSLRSRRSMKRRRALSRSSTQLHLETLELRALPANFTWIGPGTPIAESEPNDTLDVAQNLGTFPAIGSVGVTGTIGDSPAGAADVDWYQFTLPSPADVHFATLNQAGGSSQVPVLSLYNKDDFDFTDTFDPLHRRLLAQDDGAAHGGDAALNRTLGAGTYFVAVSGSGNSYFHPLIAASGFAGSTGPYGLLISTSSGGIAASDGPAVLSVDPAPNENLTQSPFVVRADFSGQLAPWTFNYTAVGQSGAIPTPGQTIELRYSGTGNFTAGNYSDIPITPNFDNTGDITNPVNELQIIPAAPLAPGYYQVFLAGNAANNLGNGLTDINGVALGQNAGHPVGADFTSTFRVNGIDGVTGATLPADTIAHARELGNITAAGIVQASGAIGVDPTDPAGMYDPSNVEVYHFQISGSGHFGFSAEAFAGRIGSPLTPALTLLQRDSGGVLHLVDVNSGSGNQTLTSDQSARPLASDPALLDGLTAGDYFIVVSAVPNFPDVTVPWHSGTQANGSFDPTTSESSNLATLGQWNATAPTTGPYVLNVAAYSDNSNPTVVSSDPADGATLAGPPTEMAIQFDKPINLITQANDASARSGSAALQSVFIVGPDGHTKYFPRVQGSDPNANSLDLLLLDDLAPGAYQLHLSGPLGVADFAGNPLLGNDPSGDYVIPFTVSGTAQGANGDPLRRIDQEPNDSANATQNLGVFFPNELAHITNLPGGGYQNGITITRDFTQSPGSALSDTADYYEFQVLQENPGYVITLNGLNVPVGESLQFSLWAAGSANALASGVSTFGGTLAQGTYVIGVNWLSASDAPNIKYNLNVAVAGLQDNPPPLTYGPGPAVRIRLATNAPPPPTSQPPAPAPSQPPSTPSTPPAGQSSSSNSSNSTPPATNSTPPVAPLPPSTPVTNTQDGSMPPPPPVVSSAPSSNPVAPPRLTLPTIPSSDGNSGSATSVASGSSSNSPATGASMTGSVPAFGTSLSLFSTIPSGVLLALGAGPTGGVQTYSLSTNPVADHVVVQGYSPLPVDGFVRVATLTQAGQYTGSDPKSRLDSGAVNQAPANPGSSLPNWNPETAKQWLRWLEAALDAFFDGTPSVPPTSPAGTETQTPNVPAIPPTADDSDQTRLPSTMPSRQQVVTLLALEPLPAQGEPAWAGLVAFIGAAGLADTHGTRRGKKKGSPPRPRQTEA